MQIMTPMKLAAMVLGAATLSVAAQTPPPAQAPPGTEVYLAPLVNEAGKVGLSQWINISNNAGYDNQPSFLPDSSAVLFSSQRDGKQMDIYRYTIGSKQITQLTNTPEGEYSPTVTPDGRTFSVIRTEADGTQRLWRFDLNGSNPRLVLENVKPVGYHAWIDATHLALFILGAGGGAPSTLQLADTATGTAKVIATNVGRSILIRPGKGTVSFLAAGETPRMLKEFDPKTEAITPLIAPITGSQDCAWLPDGRLLMASGTSISLWSGGSTPWLPLVTFMFAQVIPAPPSFVNITRMAVSPDGKWLAFVAEPK